MTLRTLNYGNYGTFLVMGSAGFCPSTVSMRSIAVIILQPCQSQRSLGARLLMEMPRQYNEVYLACQEECGVSRLYKDLALVPKSRERARHTCTRN